MKEIKENFNHAGFWLFFFSLNLFNVNCLVKACLDVPIKCAWVHTLQHWFILVSDARTHSVQSDIIMILIALHHLIVEECHLAEGKPMIAILYVKPCTDLIANA